MFKVSLITKDAQVLFEGMALSAIFPGEGGELTILSFHCPIVFRLKRGVIKVDTEDFPVSDGIAMMADNELHAIIE